MLYTFHTYTFLVVLSLIKESFQQVRKIETWLIHEDIASFQPVTEQPEQQVQILI